ncbi:DUF6287 domain-containing protein [Bifidobacterium sp. ESL0763]|uniref:DUF6287 domain-containing protein n=1 Tax=Bifidobacterium sp. ESL0763 TaxID=2983227 RepID=UPI0023F983EE|nr:DUF6287 domain-containing protein [Bifidobacterium sp. ESL0763]MDF7664041.1 DUF6287 domain-containing protein [Bifidobacterium sp. ESL0763]
MQRNDAYSTQDLNIPPLPSGAAVPMPPTVPLPGDPVPQPGASNGHKKRNIIIAAVAAVAVLLACGGVGFHFYSQHSHSYALSRYQKASHRLADARGDLRSSVSKAKSAAGQIDDSQVEDASLIDDYDSAMKKTRKVENSRPAVSVHDTESASTTDLRNATQSLDDLAGDFENAAADVTKAAQKVVDSKTAADKVLKPAKDAVTAAEAQKKANDTEAANNGVNIDAIERGDYSSLDGTWTNSNGKWIKISHGILTPQWGFEGTTPPYHLHACNGYRSQCVEHGMPGTQTELVQGGAFVDHHGHSVDFQANLLVVEKNAEFDNTAPFNLDESDPDPTDQSQDRIIPYVPSFSQGQYPPCSNPDTTRTDGDDSHPYPTVLNPSCAYYRAGGNVSEASQQKLNDKVNTAKNDLASLDKQWEQKAKAALQCRLDMVTGAQSSCPAN